MRFFHLKNGWEFGKSPRKVALKKTREAATRNDFSCNSIYEWIFSHIFQSQGSDQKWSLTPIWAEIFMMLEANGRTMSKIQCLNARCIHFFEIWLHPWSLTARPWKMVVGRLLSYWGPVTFQGRTVKLREGIGQLGYGHCTIPKVPTSQLTRLAARPSGATLAMKMFFLPFFL